MMNQMARPPKYDWSKIDTLLRVHIEQEKKLANIKQVTIEDISKQTGAAVRTLFRRKEQIKKEMYD